MVSFKALLSFASLAVVCSAYVRRGDYGNYGYGQYKNATSSCTEESTTGTYSYPTGTGLPSHESLPTDKEDNCVTSYETKTYTYTLGSGQAVTTCITKTHVSTVGAENHYPTAAAEAVSYSSTTTSTATDTVFITHPYPSYTPVGAEDHSSYPVQANDYSSHPTEANGQPLSPSEVKAHSSYPTPAGPAGPAEVGNQPACTPVTIYANAHTVYVTVPYTVTVTAAPGASTVEPKASTYVPPAPVYNHKPAYAPYNNSTIKPTFHTSSSSPYSPSPYSPSSYSSSTYSSSSAAPRTITVVPYQ